MEPIQCLLMTVGKHRDRVAWWNMATDERSSTRNIFKEAHNIIWDEGVGDGERMWNTYMKR